jgi:hypothetical protein
VRGKRQRSRLPVPRDGGIDADVLPIESMI